MVPASSCDLHWWSLALPARPAGEIHTLALDERDAALLAEGCVADVSVVCAGRSGARIDFLDLHPLHPGGAIPGDDLAALPFLQPRFQTSDAGGQPAHRPFSRASSSSTDFASTSNSASRRAVLQSWTHVIPCIG